MGKKQDVNSDSDSDEDSDHGKKHTPTNDRKKPAATTAHPKKKPKTMSDSINDKENNEASIVSPTPLRAMRNESTENDCNDVSLLNSNGEDEEGNDDDPVTQFVPR